jgi:hypothetical protein
VENLAEAESLVRRQAQVVDLVELVDPELVLGESVEVQAEFVVAQAALLEQVEVVGAGL